MTQVSLLTEDSLSKVMHLDFKGLEPASNLGPKPELTWLPKDWLFVNQVYQRTLASNRSRRLVRQIVETFSWARFQPITVTMQADGQFAVIDGQHRAAAALLHPAVVEVPAWVVDTPELRAQAKVFVGVNSDRNAMTTMQLFRAQLAARDPDAVQVQEVCRRAGVTIAFHLVSVNKVLPPRHTMAVSTIRKLIGKHGERHVVTALKSMADAYHNVENQLRGQSIVAVTALFVEYADRIDRDRLVAVLSEIDCEGLIDDARQVKKIVGGSTESGMTTVLIRHYDKGLPLDKRLQPQARAA